MDFGSGIHVPAGEPLVWGLEHHILFFHVSKLFLARLNVAWAPAFWEGKHAPSVPLPVPLPRHQPWSRDARRRAGRARGARLISAEGGACAGPGAAARPLKSRRLRLSSFLFSLSGPFV